jgi:hypothetical protein
MVKHISISNLPTSHIGSPGIRDGLPSMHPAGNIEARARLLRSEVSCSRGPSVME